ncbi:hydroxymethylpyrimidine/phosphomethylpyrimidine kinase [Streptomyces sp. NPDC050658]|uniref:bifunctional hydroxymethylpyrimidine kinase/phosphomethylpyrimidine kinase n=1 Tax=unclassified Streptomyces TaxID=2593676 RepID=UPI00344AD764
MTAEGDRTHTFVTIGSSDSSGGAGVAADIKAFTSVGAHAAYVLTAVTAQNTVAVRAYHPLPLWLVEAQLDSIAEDMEIDAMKVGVVGDDALAALLARRLPDFAAQGVPIVVDPVMVTAGGMELGGSGGAVQILRESLLATATVVTPNLSEARVITASTGRSSPQELAEGIVALGAQAVVLTDAFAPDSAMDWLQIGAKGTPIGGGSRSSSRTDHGAGCMHSALVAACLGQGFSVEQAADEAHRRVYAAIMSSSTTVGQGHHPVAISLVPNTASSRSSLPHPTSSRTSGPA